MSFKEEKEKSLKAHEEALLYLLEAKTFKKLCSVSDKIADALKDIPYAINLRQGISIIDTLTEDAAMDLREQIMKAMAAEIAYLKGKRKDHGYY